MDRPKAANWHGLEPIIESIIPQNLATRNNQTTCIPANFYAKITKHFVIS